MSEITNGDDPILANSVTLPEKALLYSNTINYLGAKVGRIWTLKEK